MTDETHNDVSIDGNDGAGRVDWLAMACLIWWIDARGHLCLAQTPLLIVEEARNMCS
jgi:hypothetical protein